MQSVIGMGSERLTGVLVGIPVGLSVGFVSPTLSVACTLNVAYEQFLASPDPLFGWFCGRSVCGSSIVTACNSYPVGYPGVRLSRPPGSHAASRDMLGLFPRMQPLLSVDV